MAVLGDVNWPPEAIRTERLLLRPTKGGDRPGYIELLCSEDVRRYLGGPRARDAVEAAVPEVPGVYPGLFAVDFDGRFVGAVTIERRDGNRVGHLKGSSDELEVSYAFLPDSWGRGLAAEAVAAVLDWAWNCFPDEPVILCTQVANVRSMALATRLGFSETETFEEHGAKQWLGVRWPAR